jgi:hypothetical protein
MLSVPIRLTATPEKRSLGSARICNQCRFIEIGGDRMFRCRNGVLPVVFAVVCVAEFFCIGRLSAGQIAKKDLLAGLSIGVLEGGTLESVGDARLTLRRGDAREQFYTNDKSALCIDNRRVASLRSFKKYLGKTVTVASSPLIAKGPAGEQYAMLIQFPVAQVGQPGC